MSVRVVGLLAALIVLPACGPSVPPGRFDGRNGRADALADIAARKQTRLYAQTFDGIAPTNVVFGIDRCDPAGDERIDTRFIPELALRKNGDKRPRSERLTPIGALKQMAAYLGFGGDEVPRSRPEWAASPQTVAYVMAYNLTIFEKRRETVLQVCPKAIASRTFNRTGSR